MWKAMVAAKQRAVIVRARIQPAGVLLPVKITMLVNPRSGRGRAVLVTQQASDALTRAGHEVVLHQARSPGDVACDVLVIVGGDGTVNRSLDSASRMGVPVWHLPLGTENLFARNFGMSIDPGALVRAVEAMSVAAVDLVECCVMPVAASPPGQPARLFSLMLSIGPDAGVVRRLSEWRTGTIRHSSYLWPIVNEVISPSLSPMTVEVDGRCVVDDRRGLLVVSNSPEYGVRLNPSPHAVMTDGVMDLVFFPAETSLEVLAWAARSRLGTHLRSTRLVRAVGRHIRVRRCGGELPFQLDGEFGGVIGRDQELMIRVLPGAMRVLRSVG